MRLWVGLFDRLFGKRITIEVPNDGGPRPVRVTERWLKQMEQEGRMAPVRTVTVHVADTLRGEYTAEWTIDGDIPREMFERRFDPAEGCLYAIVVYRDGLPETHVTDKGTWTQARQIVRR
jgi:hypothetical protein